jgi:predicted pyridoxine 5'-phosphate oxidase superfamily flavin-nucleotide-binding protein
MYHDRSREVQDRFDSRRIADRIESLLVHDHLDANSTAVIEAADMFFLATADGNGQPTCSYKGGDPGFVRVLDERSIAFPSYDGNGMFLSVGNVLQNPHVGLLFIDFEQRNRLRLEGVASIDPGDGLLDETLGAQLIVRIAVTRVFPNCPRYIHKMVKAEPAPHIPRANVETPPAEWKQSSWACDALPAGDPSKP